VAWSTPRVEEFLLTLLFFVLMPKSSYARWSSHKEVDQRTNPVGQDNDQHPNNLVVPFRWLIDDAISHYPDPESKSCESEKRKDAQK
jgi:hypothetical protein